MNRVGTGNDFTGHGNEKGCKDDLLINEKCSQHSPVQCSESTSSNSPAGRSPIYQTSNLYQLCVKCSKFFLSSSFIVPNPGSNSHEETYLCKTCLENDSCIRDGYISSDSKDCHSKEVFKTEDTSSSKLFIFGNGNKNSIASTSGCVPIEVHRKVYPCSVCGKSFSRSDSRHVHERIHSGEKPYICKLCGRGFQTSSHLKKHHRVHSGEKPYQCSLCESRFSESSSLNRHMLIHSGEKDYKCEICNKRFSLLQSLARHRRCHTGEKPYTCNLCNQSFTAISTLHVHKRIHSGERPYVCPTCEKGFYTNSHLIKHLRVHSGEKPYKCDTCERQFSDSSSLKRHSSKHLTMKEATCGEI